MQITWLGHASFRLELGEQVLLIDPWLIGNPSFPDERREEAIAGATAILLTHGHFDHAADIRDIAEQTNAPIYAMVELAGIFEDSGLAATGFNYGGTVAIGDVQVTMVKANHSSCYNLGSKYIYAGGPAGFMITHAGRTIYLSGDTDIMADMEWMGELHKPEIGILCAGGHFTMDMARAAYAAKKYFNFKTVIPCHYKTFPLLEQSADALKAGLPGVDVLTPDVMEILTL
ncbi:MAG: metal-dependent hydrolase [Litoreibacter sp.]|nr:metal-dependent hydrolase [Litoreibacter sp.]